MRKITSSKYIATKEQMNQWYVSEKRSYRWIMSRTGCTSARAIKRLLTEYNIDIRRGSAAVAAQWIDADNRRERQANRAAKNFYQYWGTQSKRPEVAAKIAASKTGEKNPMWGRREVRSPNWCGGKQSWRFKRKINKPHRQKILDTLGNKCSRCGTLEGITIHHDPPWRIIRSHELKYLSLLCKTCHFKGPIRER